MTHNLEDDIPQMRGRFAYRIEEGANATHRRTGDYWKIHPAHGINHYL